VINPLYWLELRIRAREKRLWVLALFFVVSLLIISGVVLATTLLQGAWTMIEPAGVGTGLLWATLFCQAGLLVILAPLATAGRISQEREQRTLPALINSPAPPLRITMGKLLGAWTFVGWLAVLALPFLGISALWGGPGMPRILLCMAFNLGAGLTLATVSLGLSGLFGRSLTSYLVTGAFLFGWAAVLPMVGSLAMALNPNGGAKYMDLIAFATMYHNPFFPLTMLLSFDWSLAGETIARLLYCLAVWCVIAVIFAVLAVRGLRREVY
jgi:ABC-type transport system involved in multi-copper enzyme maturation permease subunit